MQFIGKIPIHLRDQKKLLKTKLARNNSKIILLNFDFDPKHYIDVDLLFDLRKTRRKRKIDRIIEKLPDNNSNLYIEHKEGTNLFRIRYSKKQKEKDNLSETLTNLDKKIMETENKIRISQLRHIKNQTK